jgi:hypothetical protein
MLALSDKECSPIRRTALCKRINSKRPSAFAILIKPSLAHFDEEEKRERMRGLPWQAEP